MALRALIVDDEELARARVRDFLKEDKDVVCVGEAECASQAIEMILETRPDVLFLDVQMPEMDGFGVLEAVRNEYLPFVIFTTAHDEHAIRAFEVRAVDYLLKPFSKARFEEAVSRLKGPNRRSLKDNLRSLLEEIRRQDKYPSKLPIKANGKVVILSTDQIEWIEAERDYIRFCGQKGSYLVRGTMANIQASLPEHKFVRIHRSTIVNVDYIAELNPIQRGEYAVRLKSGKELTLSRSHRDAIAKMLPLATLS
jgi:two-component system, LytTR family, response regulator